MILNFLSMLEIFWDILNIFLNFHLFLFTEAVAWRFSLKKVLLQI